MASHVIMDDGSEPTLSDHLRTDHRKGTRGLTDEYLASMHATLHAPDREPRPQHDHPGQDSGQDSGQAGL